MAKPSARRVAAWQDLRAYERHREAWDRDASRGWAGSALLRRVEAAGRLRPYHLPAWWSRACRSHAAARVVGWVAACWLMRRRVLVCGHRTMAALAGCSTRTAGSAMREAVEAGWVERRTHYRRARIGSRVKWTQLACSYRPSKRLESLLLSKGGNGCQPTELQPFGQEKKKVSPVGDGSIQPGTGDSIGRANVVARFARLGRLAEIAERLGPAPPPPDPEALRASCPGYGVRGHAGCAICCGEGAHV